MKHIWKTAAATSCLSILVGAGALFAKPSPRPEPQPQRTQELRQSRDFAGLLKSDDLIGTPIRNDRGEKIGSIEQFLVNAETGELEFAIVDVGGFLGFREREVAVPWNEMTVLAHDSVTADLTKEVLTRAPRFDEKSWESMRDHSAWKAEVEEYYKNRR